METPKTEAGRRTELVCARVKKKLPELTTPQYNAIWSSCLEVLTEEDEKFTKQFKSLWL